MTVCTVHVHTHAHIVMCVCIHTTTVRVLCNSAIVGGTQQTLLSPLGQTDGPADVAVDEEFVNLTAVCAVIMFLPKSNKMQ